MIDTPRGVKALLYQEASLKQRIEKEILTLFDMWGFQRVETPAIEFLSELSKGLDDEGLKRVITFTDPAGGGKPLALRSDVTPQIARIAATALAERPAPIRLSYAQTVYRSIRPGAGHRMEVYQAGVELIGLGSPEADAEMIAIAMESLERLGFTGVKMAISHMGYIMGVLDVAGLEKKDRVAIKKALMRKDTKEIDRVLDAAGVPEREREAVIKLPNLFGNREIIDKADAVNEQAKASLENLRDVLAVLEKYGRAGEVTIDLGETRGFGYYTGVTFEGFVKGAGKRVLSGGRYDKLLAEYGADRPATGFAIDVDRILDHLTRAGEPAAWSAAEVLVVGANGNFMEAAGLAKKLRERGVRTARDIIVRPIEESVSYARRLKIGAVVITGLPELSGDKAKLLRTATGEEKILGIDDLLSEITIAP